ncbi:MAG: hypothetical protein V9G19_19845 [Tetrasphaera sp.]
MADQPTAPTRNIGGGLIAASGTLALIAFVFCGVVFDGWAWAWVFFLVPAAIRAFQHGSRG